MTSATTASRSVRACEPTTLHPTPPRFPLAGGRLPRRVTSGWPAARRWAAGQPLTVGLALGMMALGTTLVVAAGGADAATAMFGYGADALDGRWWRFVVGAAILPDPRLYLVMVPLVVLAVGGYERRVGWRRAAGVLAVTQLAGTVGAAVLVRTLTGTGWPSMEFTAGETDLGLSAGVIGVVAAFSATLPAASRRTLRWAGTGFLSVMLLRSGLPWDLEHLLGWLSGLWSGSVARVRSGATARAGSHVTPEPATRRSPTVRARWIAAWSLLVLVGSELVLVLYPGVGGLFAAPPQPDSGSGRLCVTVLLAAAAVLIADALRRGLPLGWWAGAVFAAGMSAGSVLAGGADAAAGIGALCWAALLGALLIGRGYWPSRVPTASLRRAARWALLAGIGFVAALAAVMWLLRGAVAASRPHESLRQILLRAVFADSDLDPQTAWAAAVLMVTSGLWALVLLVLLARLLHLAAPAWPRQLRSARATARGLRTAGHADEARGWSGRLSRGQWRERMLRHGGGNLGWQRTWPHVEAWQGSGRAAEVSIGYRLEQSVAIVVGDPVGPEEHWRAAAEQFSGFAQHHGWTVAWYAVSGRFLDLVRPARSLRIGEDAVIDLADLRFTGKAWQDVRTARNKAAGHGITLREVRFGGLTPALRAEIDTVSALWTGGKALPEMGFSLGTVALADDGQMRTMIAVDEAGTVHGITTWMPIFDDGRVVGWTLDVMRRRPDGFRPVMEFLIAECLLRFQAEGSERVSLSAAPLARSGSGGPGADPLERSLDRIAGLLEPVYGFRSLLAYKRKFGPRFEPVHLAYGSAWELSEIGLAVCHAYLPDLTAAQALSVGRALRDAHRRSRRGRPGRRCGPASAGHRRCRVPGAAGHGAAET